MDAALLFSGGVDSTLAAVLLAEQFERVRLVTYDHGRWSGHLRLGNAMRRGREVRRCLGTDRVSHELIPLSDFFRRFVTSTLQADYQRYGTNTCCVGCKLAMHTRTVLYALERGVGQVADGSAADQAYHAEQLSGVLAVIRRLYERYGITYANPSFSIDQAERRERLRRAGLRPRGLQPRCLFGAYDFFIHTPLHIAHHHEEHVMTRYMEDKYPLAVDVIDKTLNAAHGRRLLAVR